MTDDKIIILDTHYRKTKGSVKANGWKNGILRNGSPISGHLM